MNQNLTDKRSVKYQVWDNNQCAEVVNAAFRILERTGCEVLNNEALELLKKAGCLIEGERVRIPSSFLKWAIDSAPSSVTLYDRLGNPAMKLAPYETYFGPAITTTFTLDVETGEKRPGVKEDAVNSALVCDALPNIAWSSALNIISDGNTKLADIYEIHSLLPNTVKPIMFWAYDTKNLAYEFEMFEAVAGGAEKLREKPFVINLICPRDPLIHTEEGMAQIIYMAEKSVPALYIPGISFGGSGPITLAGSIALGLADMLVGLLVSQLVRKGAPFIACKFHDNMNMKTATVSHSRPELILANSASADVFRYMGLPFCINSGSTDTGIFDQVSAFDIAVQVYTSVLSSANMNFASGSSLEGSNTNFLGGMVYCNEIISFIKRLTVGIEINESTLAEDVIHKVGPGGNFLAEEQTFKQFREFWVPSVLAPRSHDEWLASGKKDMRDVLNDRVKEFIARGPQNPLGEDILKKLDEIMDRAEKDIARA